MKKYYNLAVNEETREADIYIFGDILEPTSQAWFGVEADVSAYSLAQEIEGLDVDKINVHINSYGGHVSDGWAIYNMLVAHKAAVTTINEGFACSAASVVFMAGTVRIMRKLSALFIHNVQSSVYGDAEAKRKAAQDDDAMSRASAQAYLAHVNISEEQLMGMLKAETWIFPEDALKMGFASAIEDETAPVAAVQTAKQSVFQRMFPSEPTAPAPEPGNPPPDFEAKLQKLETTVAQLIAKFELPAPPATPENKKTFFNFGGDSNA